MEWQRTLPNTASHSPPFILDSLKSQRAASLAYPLATRCDLAFCCSKVVPTKVALQIRIVTACAGPPPDEIMSNRTTAGRSRATGPESAISGHRPAKAPAENTSSCKLGAQGEANASAMHPHGPRLHHSMSTAGGIVPAGKRTV